MQVFQGGLTQEQLWQMENYYDSLSLAKKLQEHQLQEQLAKQEAERQRKKIEETGIGMVISLTKMQNNKSNMQSKDCSRAFYPYQAMDMAE